MNEELNVPLVSAVITTHNRLSLLPRAIDSVLAQTYKNIECIVVSDASDDGTVEYCQKRNDITFINIDKVYSKGGNYARNLGIKAAKGVYVAFLDDDDSWLPTKIEKQVAIAKGENCGLVYCLRRIEILDGNGVTYNDEVINNDGECGTKNCGNVSRTALFSILTTTSCVLIKRSLLLEVGMFDENLHFWQETELSIRLAQKTSYYFVPECLTIYRIDTNDNGKLTNKFNPWLDSVKYIYKKHINLYKGLTDVEFLKYLLLVWDDAFRRAKNAKLTEKYDYFQTLIFKGLNLLEGGLTNRKPWHCFPLYIGFLWYVNRRQLTIESNFMKFLISCRKKIIWCKKRLKSVNNINI